MKKKLKTEWLITIITLILFIFVMEIALRLTEVKSESENEFKFYEYDALLGWKNKPNSTGILNLADASCYVQINSKGLRDVEHTYDKGNMRRILFYGDSFTWGYGVNQEDRYTDILRNKTGFDIINMGTTGYGTGQMYLYHSMEGYKYNPDIIVIAYHNDAWDVSQEVAYTYPKPRFRVNNSELVLTNVPVPTRNTDWTTRYELQITPLDNFKTYVFFRNKIYNLVKKPYIERNPESIEIIDKLITRMNSFNSTLVILIIPDSTQVFGKGNTAEIDYIIRLGTRENITVINPIERLGEYPEDIYFSVNRHFTKKGNLAMADILYEEFKDGFNS